MTCERPAAELRPNERTRRLWGAAAAQQGAQAWQSGKLGHANAMRAVRRATQARVALLAGAARVHPLCHAQVRAASAVGNLFGLVTGMEPEALSHKERRIMRWVSSAVPRAPTLFAARGDARCFRLESALLAGLQRPPPTQALARGCVRCRLGRGQVS